MGFNANATTIPGKGTVLVAPPDTAAPDYETLDPTGTIPGGWEALGHTSRDNNVSLSKSGGDATQRGSWWDDALRSTYDPITWSVNVSHVVPAGRSTRSCGDEAWYSVSCFIR